MKRYIFLILTLFLLQAGQTITHAQIIGDSWENPFNAGTYSNGFFYTDAKSTYNSEFTNRYGWRSTKEICYKFVITQRMKIKISLCYSATETYLTLLNYQGLRIGYNITNSGCCPGSKYSCISTELPAGTYYAVCQGDYYDGYIRTDILGTLLTPTPVGDNMSDPLIAGTYSDSFRYSNTQNTTQGFTNQYNGRATSDVFYKLTTTQKMDITVSLCNSELNDTYLWMLDSNGSLIASNKNYCGSRSTLSMPALAAGTYYIVSEGNTEDGSINGYDIDMNDIDS